MPLWRVRTKNSHVEAPAKDLRGFLAKTLNKVKQEWENENTMLCFNVFQLVDLCPTLFGISQPIEDILVRYIVNPKTVISRV